MKFKKILQKEAATLFKIIFMCHKKVWHLESKRMPWYILHTASQSAPFAVLLWLLVVYMLVLNCFFSEFTQDCLDNIVCDIHICFRSTKGHPASCWRSHCHTCVDNACYLWNGEEWCVVDSLRYGLGGGTLVYMLWATGVWYYICYVWRKAWPHSWSRSIFQVLDWLYLKRILSFCTTNLW